MRILFFGDLYGRCGRDALLRHLPSLKEKMQPDFIIVNGDNAAHGRGITEEICKDLFKAGVDCITAGDHVWDQREIIPYIGRTKNLVRPQNYKKGTPGNGIYEHRLEDGRQIKILHLQGRIFMKAVECPFTEAEKFAQENKLQKNVFTLIDFHAEATSEKMAMGQYMDGKVSAVVGSHTHIPTADCQIFPGGTAYQTDAGMVGDYDSVIGAEKDGPIDNFVKQMPRVFKPAEGEATVCGTFIVSDDKTGLALRIEPVRVGGKLSSHVPLA